MSTNISDIMFKLEQYGVPKDVVADAVTQLIIAGQTHGLRTENGRGAAQVGGTSRCAVPKMPGEPAQHRSLRQQGQQMTSGLPEGTWGYHAIADGKWQLWQVHEGEISHIGVIEADEACANFICEKLNAPPPELGVA